jgi:hypothetical protein
VTVQAPGIGDVGASGHPSLAAWLHGIGVRQIRLITGLIMFAYIFSHFFNHALGNISYDLMETWLKYHVWWWRIPIVNDTLYLAAIVHFSLGLWALYQRRHFRYSTAEITQLVLGLSIPLWLASHLGAERVGGALFGWPPFNYASALYTYWVTERYNIAVQFISLTVAWTHACIGLYFWLRLKSFFDWAAPILLSIAILMPPLAMIGAHHGVLIVTPEYNSSVPALVKNTIDWISRVQDPHETRGQVFRERVFAIAAASGNRLGGTRALAALRLILTACHAPVVPNQLALSYADQAYDEMDHLKHPADIEALKALVRQLIDHSQRMM